MNRANLNVTNTFVNTVIMNVVIVAHNVIHKRMTFDSIIMAIINDIKEIIIDAKDIIDDKISFQDMPVYRTLQQKTKH